MRINIALIPPPDISHLAAGVSRFLSGQGGSFTLDENGPYPHITLYMTDAPDHAIEDVCSLLEENFVKEGEIFLKMLSYRWKPDGFVDVAFDNTETLADLQERIALSVNPLREQMLAHAEIFSALTDKQKDNTIRFGYPEVGNLFRPHLTFTRLDPSVAREDVLSLMPKHDFSFQARELCVSLVGGNGTCIKFFKRISLP